MVIWGKKLVWQRWRASVVVSQQHRGCCLQGLLLMFSKIRDVFPPAPQSDVCTVQAGCCYLPWVQFLSYIMLPSLSSVWHLGNLRVTTKVTLDPISAGLSVSSLAVTLPPVERKTGLHGSKGCIRAAAAFNCALFTLQMLYWFLCFQGVLCF